MKKCLFFLILSFVFSFLSCSKSKKDESKAFDPRKNPAVCDSEPHKWLPVKEMGTVVMWENAAMTDLSKDTIDGLLKQNNMEKLTPVEFGVKNYIMRYKSQDRGKQKDATAVVGIPDGVESEKKVPIIIWLHGTAGFNDECAPSRAMLEGIIPTTLIASMGYIGIAPDFPDTLGIGEPSPEGSIQPYLVGEPVALTSIDSIRAVIKKLTLTDFGVQGDLDNIILWGGSQGGHAALFCNLYAPYYAPEMTIRAVVSGVGPSDIIDMSKYAGTNWGASSAMLAYAMVAMRKWYGKPDDMSTVLTDTEPHHLAVRLPEYMSSMCGTEEDLSDIDELADVFTIEYLDAISKDNWEGIYPFDCYLKENSLSRTSVLKMNDTPILTTFAQNDELVVANLAKQDIFRLCDMGYRIEHLECENKSHGEGGLAAIPYMIDWMKKRLKNSDWDENKICNPISAVNCDELP